MVARQSAGHRANPAPAGQGRVGAVDGALARRQQRQRLHLVGLRQPGQRFKAQATKRHRQRKGKRARFVARALGKGLMLVGRGHAPHAQRSQGTSKRCNMPSSTAWGRSVGCATAPGCRSIRGFCASEVFSVPWRTISMMMRCSSERIFRAAALPGVHAGSPPAPPWGWRWSRWRSTGMAQEKFRRVAQVLGNVGFRQRGQGGGGRKVSWPNRKAVGLQWPRALALQRRTLIILKSGPPIIVNARTSQFLHPAHPRHPCWRRFCCCAITPNGQLEVLMTPLQQSQLHCRALTCSQRRHWAQDAAQAHTTTAHRPAQRDDPLTYALAAINREFLKSWACCWHRHADGRWADDNDIAAPRPPQPLAGAVQRAWPAVGRRRRVQAGALDG